MDIKTNFHIQCNLKFSISPVSVDDLSYLLDDSEFHRIVKDASLYMICQRPCLLFRNLSIKNHENIQGEIFQTGKGKSINFDLPIYQKNIVQGEKRALQLKFSRNFGFQSKTDFEDNGLLEEMDNIELIIIKEKTGEHIKYITPDVILEKVWSKKWNCNISGELEYGSTFVVHYIGESVRQPIWKRLKSHSKLQHILSRENSFYPGIKLASELTVLLFRIADTYDLRKINGMSREELQQYLSNYPESINGVKHEDYNYLTYMIDEPITLVYGEKLFRCAVNDEKINTIFVDFENSKVEIQEHCH